jgi:hypothetical protein
MKELEKNWKSLSLRAKGQERNVWNSFVSCRRYLVWAHVDHKPEKVIILLDKISWLISADYDGSFGWSFRILMTDILPSLQKREVKKEK